MQQLVAVAEHERAEAVPLGLEEPARRRRAARSTRLASIGRTGGGTASCTRGILDLRHACGWPTACSCSRPPARAGKRCQQLLRRRRVVRARAAHARRGRAARRGVQLPVGALLPRQAHLRAALRAPPRGLPGRARDHAGPRARRARDAHHARRPARLRAGPDRRGRAALRGAAARAPPRRCARGCRAGSEVVLLGSIATREVRRRAAAGVREVAARSPATSSAAAT